MARLCSTSRPDRQKFGRVELPFTGQLSVGTIAAIIFAKLKRVSFWQLADLVAPSVALGQAIGRWGKFL